MAHILSERLHALRAFSACSAVLILTVLLSSPASARQSFADFLSGLWPEARDAGVSRQTFTTAFDGVRPDLSLPDLVLPGKPKVSNKGQAEFTKTAKDYLSKPYMKRLAAQGRKFFLQHRQALQRIEARTGVDPYILVAIWGRETAYGFHKLRHDAIRALATLAYVGRRKEMFREELIAALRMLEAGVPRSDMRSSWAGALGLTQFMPTEYFKHAADGDGDGKADIWRSIPDALASAARQLEGKGWRRGEGWGYEVVLGPGSDCALEGPPDERLIREWMQLGMKRADGNRFTEAQLAETAYLMSPAGTYGPNFLAAHNFKVIRLYNTSDLYALFVGHLSDLIRGHGDFITPWGDFEQPRAKTVHDLQARLKELGYGIGKVDGKIGSNTRKQIGLFQRAEGVKVDCWPSRSALAHAQRAGAR